MTQGIQVGSSTEKGKEMDFLESPERGSADILILTIGLILYF